MPSSCASPRAYPEYNMPHITEGFMLPGRRVAPCSLFLLALLVSCFVSCLTPAVSFAVNGSIWLRWTATGDDGTTGRAARYDIRYSRYPIAGTDTVGWWNAATI